MAHARRFRFAQQLVQAATGKDWAALARGAEADGFAVLSLPDHLGEQFAPIPALAAAAMVTERIRFSMFVLANDNRHPGILAKEITTVDVLSHGRMELGIGAGWTKTEYDALGMTFDKPSIRIERLGEAAKILRGAFTQDAVTFAGKYYNVTDLAIRPRPAQKGGIPILMGGGGPKMLALAAREADIVSVASNNAKRPKMTDPLDGFAFDKVAAQVAGVREAAGARFDALELNVRILAVAVTDDRDAAARQLYAQMQVPAEDLLSSPFAFIGSLAQIEDQIRRQRDQLGVSYYTVSQRHAAPLAPLVERLAGT